MIKRFTLAVLFVLANASHVIARDQPVQIWFTPLTHNLKPGGRGLEYVKHDFPALLDPGARWQLAASRLSEISLQANVVWSYSDLPAVVAFTRSRPWKVGLGFSVMFDGGACPRRLEGISADPDANREAIVVAKRWKEAGGRLDYINMDSPLWFGHFQDTQCSVDISEVARRTATTVKGILSYFPEARIVDAEGPGWIPDGQWLSSMATFLDDLRNDTGRSIFAVSLDLHWHDLRPGSTWQGTARSALQFFHSRGTAVGLIENAERGPGVTEASWMQTVRQHLRETADAKLGLDFVYLAQWQKYAVHNLPENDPIAYTSLINDAYADLVLGKVRR